MNSIIRKIQNRIGTAAVAMPVFGTPESMARAALLLRALPPSRVHFIHINHGMLRLHEAEEIERLLRLLGAENILRIEAYNEFLTAVSDMDGKLIGPLSTACRPNEKRAIMDAAYKRAFSAAAAELGGDTVIFGADGFDEESLSLDTAEISLLVGEYRDEFFILRQPFPPCSLAIRILCNESPIATTSEQRLSFIDELHASGGSHLSGKVLPIRSVGVDGDARSYKAMALICGSGHDSDFAQMFGIAEAVLDRLQFLNRILLRIDTGEAPAIFHDRPMYLSSEVLSVLKKADAILSRELYPCDATQYFAVLIPLSADKVKPYSVVIRAVVTEDFKTARTAMPGRDISREALLRAADCIKRELCDRVSMVLYDITSKPPAAIEFE